MSTLVLVDGQSQHSLPTTDRGLQYGDGVFETIRLMDGQPLLWSEHLQRLLRGCARLGIPCEPQLVETRLAQSLALLAESETARANSHYQSGILKIMVTRGDGGRGYQPPATVTPRVIIQLHPLPQNNAMMAGTGIDCLMCEHPVSINAITAGIKHLNRLDQVMAARELMAWQGSAGPQEGLMTDGQGALIEGTRSNVFLQINGIICTPDLTVAGVAGVMRGWLLELYRKQGIQVQVRRIGAEELRVASEVFICNSVIGFWPVRRLWLPADRAGQPINFSSQSLARQAQIWSKQLLGM